MAVKIHLEELKYAYPKKALLLDFLWDDLTYEENTTGEKNKLKQLLIILDKEVYSGRGGGRKALDHDKP